MKIYQAVAEAFLSEGVRSHFTLMGDGNMHVVTELVQAGVEVFHVRDEHCAVGMAIGAWSATGELATASVTSGPGVTQIATILATAAQSRVPLVVFAGESPLKSIWNGQHIDQAAIVGATGARYIAARSPTAVGEAICEAFYHARTRGGPVVLAIPYDLQMAEMPSGFSYKPSTEFLTQRPGKPVCDPAVLAQVADLLSRAERPLLVAGRGASSPESRKVLRELAEKSGALLATTLPVRGMLDDDPFSIGIIGGFASQLAREVCLESDVVVAFGTSLAYFAVDGGQLFKNAHVVKIGLDPAGLSNGRPTAQQTVVADTEEAALGILNRVERRGPKRRTSESAAAIANTPPDPDEFEIEPDRLDPRRVVVELDRVIPKDWHIVSGAGHSSYFYSHMRHRPPGTFHVVRDFGAIGNALSIAMGVAASRGDGKVVLVDGDGGLAMTAQELETIRRHGIKLLICVLNDGAFGAEIHKLREDGFDENNAIFGYMDFTAIAQGYGLDGRNFIDFDGLDGAIDTYRGSDQSAILNFCVSRNVVSPRMRRQTRKLGA